jgi:hypothetical protein
VLLTVYCVVFGGVNALWSGPAGRDRREFLWEDSVVDSLKFYAGIDREGLVISTKKLIHDNRCTSQDSNRAYPEYRSETLWPSASSINTLAACRCLAKMRTYMCRIK